MEVNDLELWFTEEHTDNVRFSIKVDRHLFSAESEFQRIDIMDSYEFGRFLALDGSMMLTEKDEFIYHEMMVHVPMAVNLSIQKVLVIGGGDGGAVRELCRYPQIEQIDLVEIDEMVVGACKAYLKQTACALEDSRVHIYYEDGLKFIRRVENLYDLIIVDSTDPFGPGEGLFTREFYGNCFKALSDKGILVNQHESPYYKVYAQSLQKTHEKIKGCFPVTRLYNAHIPTYPSGNWVFGFASKGIDPISELDEKSWKALGIETQYYNADIHRGCFALPNYVKKLLND